jgi:hypothetical protein
MKGTNREANHRCPLHTEVKKKYVLVLMPYGTDFLTKDSICVCLHTAHEVFQERATGA